MVMRVGLILVLLLVPMSAMAQAQQPVTVTHTAPDALRAWDIVMLEWTFQVDEPINDAYLIVALAPDVYMYTLQIEGNVLRCQDIGYERYICYADVLPHDATVRMTIHAEVAGASMPIAHTRFSWLGGPVAEWVDIADIYEHYETIPQSDYEWYFPMVTND